MASNWRDRAATGFNCQKQPATGSRGMVVSNHPQDRLRRSRRCERRPRFHQRAGRALTSKAYADERRRAIDSNRAKKWSAGVAQLGSAHTIHMTAADAFGNVVATTQTINNLFGAKILIPGLGAIPNNYMNLYNPRPGRALSLAPGKRVTTSMSPMMGGATASSSTRSACPVESGSFQAQCRR
jgi:gamma-glutamyltranspeptidase